MPRRSTLIPAALALVFSSTLTACSGATGPAALPVAPSTSEHSPVDGPIELNEPALGLTTLESDGVVRQLDLADGAVSDIATVSPIADLGPAATGHTDGRYLFIQRADGLTVVDGGAWTWHHGDHAHYYRGDPGVVGTVDGRGAATVSTTNSSTSGGIGVFFAHSGEAVLLDAEALGAGEVVESFRLSLGPHAGLVVPVGSFALVTEPAGVVAQRVVAYTAAGERVEGADAECLDARGTITTRVGAVIGCADGALIATIQDGEPRIEHVPYPEGVAPAATSFANREGRPTVAALAGDDGIWLLNTRERAWAHLTAPTPLVAVTTVDDETGHVLGLSTDGRVVVIDGQTGSLRSATDPLVAGSLRDSDSAGSPTLIADEHHVYLSGPTERSLFEIEIDAQGAAIVSRSFATVADPLFLAETGR